MKTLSLLSILFFAAFVSLSMLTACGDDMETADAPDAAETTESWEVRGYFIGTDSDIGTITIIHEDIPDVMNAMRMQVLLPNPDEAQGLSRGDAISFRLYREGNSWYLEDISPLPDDEAPELGEDLMDML